MKNLKAYIAEALGTFVLVFFACGVAAITGGDLVPTALAFGFVIFAMAYAIGDISGCHINPAVSLGCFLTKRMSAKDFGCYVVAQLVGGLIGALAIFGILAMTDFNVDLSAAASNFVIGGPNTTLDAGNVIGSLLTEVILTFIFVFVILNVTAKKNSGNKFAGIIIGITLTLVHLVGIKLTGTSVNPARSIATALANLIYTGDTDALAQVWMFIIAPMGGAALAALAYNAFNKKEGKEVKTVDTKEE